MRTSSTDYCFGTGTSSQLVDYAWFLNNAEMRTWPGGLKLPNALGLFDMHGNVREWTWDWHGNDARAAITDPTGPPAGSGRVFRGGAFCVIASDCHSARRSDVLLPVFRNSPIGFRVLCGR
jgi:formylglycine-generating enzyme required for sulfatase activity